TARRRGRIRLLMDCAGGLERAQVAPARSSLANLMMSAHPLAPGPSRPRGARLAVQLLRVLTPASLRLLVLYCGAGWRVPGGPGRAPLTFAPEVPRPGRAPGSRSKPELLGRTPSITAERGSWALSLRAVGCSIRPPFPRHRDRPASTAEEDRS